MSLATQSDMIRLQLLCKYGGVWADSTTLCIRPLDAWLCDCCQSGFFAFSNPGKDREMSNWFIASEKNNSLIEKMRHKFSSFFLLNDFNINSQLKQFVKKN